MKPIIENGVQLPKQNSVFLYTKTELKIMKKSQLKYIFN